MVHNETTTQLDRVFAALSDSTRRSVLAQLARPGPAGLTVSELARPHAMSLTGFMKHLAVLEAARLIARSKEGRVVRCALDAAPMQDAAQWIAHYEHFWNERLDALGRYLDTPEDTPPCPAPHNKRQPKSASAAATAPPPRKSGARGPIRKP
jgi:DNA-binding transcriptional ArsR family regulator